MSRRFSRSLALIGSGAFLLLLVGVYVAFRPPPDPLVQGKRLSVWISEFNIWAAPQPTESAKVLAEHPAEAEGLLKHMLAARDSGLTLRIQQWLVKMKITKAKIRSARMVQTQALGVCNWLGPAVPGTTKELAALVNGFPTEQPDRVIMDYALHTLPLMGTNGAAELIRLLHHPDHYVRIESARWLGTMAHASDQGAVEALQACATIKDPPNREELKPTIELMRLFKETAKRSLELIQRREAMDTTRRTVRELGSAVKPENLWTVKQGIRITSTSGFDPGYTGLELFEGKSTAPEATSLVLRNAQSDGFVHFIEWKTAAPVTLRSFGFLASHEGGNVNFQRAFREYRLLTFDEDIGQFTPVYEEMVSIPYGKGFFLDAGSWFRNFAKPISAQRFRLEMVQHGIAKMASGPRLIELYGFGDVITEAGARSVEWDQKEMAFRVMTPDVADVVPRQ